jgi:hypothetical protein
MNHGNGKTLWTVLWPIVLPVAGVALIWAALRSPHLREASGFTAGIGATALFVAAPTA